MVKIIKYSLYWLYLRFIGTSCTGSGSETTITGFGCTAWVAWYFCQQQDLQIIWLRYNSKKMLKFAKVFYFSWRQCMNAYGVYNTHVLVCTVLLHSRQLCLFIPYALLPPLLSWQSPDDFLAPTSLVRAFFGANVRGCACAVEKRIRNALFTPTTRIASVHSSMR
jgi:hypothetical protein